MGRKHKAAGGGLGQALIKQRAQGARPTAGRYGGDRPLESITDVRDLDEVMEQAERAGRVFSALHPMPELLLEKEGDASNLTPREREEQRRAEEALHQASLTVPRRPAWEVGMTAEELDIQERQAFLTWRRGFVRLEENENLVITPFEKNIDIWRQLWRVIERSDLVVMVVDCRNPLFYRCPDLETYVQEVDPNKKTMLLLNKADLLPAVVRKQWAAYFVAKGISYLFWSAKNATAALEAKLEDLDLEDSVSDQDVAILSREELLSCLQTEAELIASTRREAIRAALAQHVGKEDGEVSQNGSSRVESSRVPSGQAGGDGAVRRVVVGFVGYPNVGKSSTINALVGGKKTGVTSTPGKTKHFQTLIINDKLMLCDCPGLVFPSFTSSRSEMVASGVLPIDRITDQRGPVDVVAQRVTRETLETVYGIKLPAPRPYEPQNRPPSASELLRAFAYSRGYVASSGLPDETRAARQILKDYSNGKLLHYLLPPDDEDDSARSLLHSRGHYQEEGASSASESLDSDEDGAYDSQDGGEDDQVRPDMLPGNEAGGAFDGDELDGEIVELQEASSSLQIEDQSPGAVNMSNQLLGLDPSTSGQGLADIFTDLDTVGNMGKRSPEKTRLKLKGGSSHKMHKKAPRKKDRSWRVQNDGSDGMPLVRGVLKPVSHGAEALRQVIV